MPHDKEHVLANVHQGGAEHVQQAIDAAATAWEDWSTWPWEDRAAVFLRAAELLSGPWRETLLAATMLGQSKTAHQAEIDAAAEAIDFFRFNIEFMLRIYAGAADLVARRVEPPRIPAARRIRLRRLTVQLHGDRRQPDELTGADGKHRRLEAGRHRDALRVLPDAALPGGGAPRRRDQSRLRQRRDDRRCRTGEPAPRRHPLHGLDARLQRHVAHRGGEHGSLPQLPAHRRRDRRQGLHRRASFRRRRLARSGDRPRLVRVPGPEVLGRLAGLRALEPVARAAGAPPGGGGVDQGRRRHRLRQLHGRRDRRRLVQDAGRGDRGGEERTRTPRSSSAAVTTTHRASSSTRRCSRRATRTSG